MVSTDAHIILFYYFLRLSGTANLLWMNKLMASQQTVGRKNIGHSCVGSETSPTNISKRTFDKKLDQAELGISA